MAKWQVPFKRRALRPIPHVVDNSAAMDIEQHNINEAHTPIRRSIMPGGKGTFSPYSNQNFK